MKMLPAFAALLLASGAAHAAPDRFVADDTQSFDAAATQLRAQLASDPSQLTSDDRRAVDADLREMGRLLRLHGSTASLDRADAVRYFNAQERVNGRLAGDLDQRYRCWSFASRLVCAAGPAAHARRSNVAQHDAEQVRSFAPIAAVPGYVAGGPVR